MTPVKPARLPVIRPGDSDGIPRGEYRCHTTGPYISMDRFCQPWLAQDVVIAHDPQVTVVGTSCTVHREEVCSIQSRCEYTWLE